MQENMNDVILELLRSKKKKELRELMTELNCVDLAYLIMQLYEEEQITREELLILFRILPKDQATDVFAEMEPETQEILIKGFTDSELREVIDDLFLDDTVDLIEEMPANIVKRILKNVDANTRKSINQLLNYPENTAGSLMTIEFVDLKKTMTVEESFSRIRRTGVDKETIYTCYVTDSNRKLLGLVSVKDLLLAQYEDVVEDIMQENVISVNTWEDQESVAQKFSKYDFIALPVVDSEGRLVGIITVDDAIDVMQEEFTEDIEKMHAIISTDKPYLRTSVFELWKARIPWLLLLMVSATVTAIILGRFEQAIAAQAILVTYMPMLMGTGGNSGSQASVTIIRGLSLGEIEFSDWLSVVWKEIRVALLCALALITANFAKLIFIDGVGMGVALVVCLALAITVVVAKMIGCILPILSKKVGLDPAVMSAPFITTIVDAISMWVYFTVAKIILKL